MLHHDIDLLFQFHYGSINGYLLQVGEICLVKFQFHYGSINGSYDEQNDA